MSEFDMPKDLDKTKPWDGFSYQWRCLFLRMRDQAKFQLRSIRTGRGRSQKQTGVAILQITCLIDERGEVLVWTEPRVLRIEPSRDAKTVLEYLLNLTSKNDR